MVKNLPSSAGDIDLILIGELKVLNMATEPLHGNWRCLCAARKTQCSQKNNNKK